MTIFVPIVPSRNLLFIFLRSCRLCNRVVGIIKRKEKTLKTYRKEKGVRSHKLIALTHPPKATIKILKRHKRLKIEW